LQDSECKLFIYSDQYADIAGQLRTSVDRINMKDIPERLKEGIRLMKEGHKEYSCITPGRDDLASIVYTSGTTGIPKGVMLSHNNLCSSLYGSCCNVWFEGASLLVLPLHHTFGLVAGVLVIMLYGYPVCINRSLKRLSADFQKYRPQNLFAVPLIVETLYKNIWSSAAKQGKDKLLKRLICIGNLLLKLKIDLRNVFFKSVMDAFGGNLNLIVSGGAPIDEKYIDGFRSFGITVLNGYGITECGPVVAVNRNRFIVPHSVGLPLCCNEVNIAENGEVLVKGENVMLGYYRDEKMTSQALTDGWFHTGDIGEIDRYGALHITGRIKNLIILANGENISAEWIEQKLYAIPYLNEVIVYGMDHLIVAEIFLDECVSDARERIDGDIKMINQQLPQNQNIGRIIIRHTEFPKTTTKKIIRKNGEKSYA
jgi:Long-chain acyl-CoA synthetases (AMP-forming)